MLLPSDASTRESGAAASRGVDAQRWHALSDDGDRGHEDARAARGGLDVPELGLGHKRSVSSRTWKVWAAWTALFWGGTAVVGTLFYVGTLDFVTSARISLYGTSVWLNGALLPLLLPASSTAMPRSRADVWHECLCLWLVSYTMTNLLWEIPWLVSSPYIFKGVDTLADVQAQTEWMRASPLHMGWWVMASFASVDLRTVSGNSTFYSLEFFAFFSVAAAAAFYRLNKRRSALRYLVPVVCSGEPVAATLIFSFSQVFAGYDEMAGGTADTLLALVWTQYQYVLYPALFGWVGWKLLQKDLHRGWSSAAEREDAV